MAGCDKGEWKRWRERLLPKGTRTWFEFWGKNRDAWKRLLRGRAEGATMEVPEKAGGKRECQGSGRKGGGTGLWRRGGGGYTACRNAALSLGGTGRNRPKGELRPFKRRESVPAHAQIRQREGTIKVSSEQRLTGSSEEKGRGTPKKSL